MSHQERFEEEKEFSFKSLFAPLTTFKAIHWIIVIGILIYANSLFNGFVMDDENQIVDAPIVHSITNLPAFFSGGTFGGNGNAQLIGGYYRPFPTVIIALLNTLFGPGSVSFHVTQVVFHIANAILLFFLFGQLLRKQKTAFVLALLFLVHPINSEAVNYISAMQTTLCFFFGLIALLVFSKKSTKLSTMFVFIFLFLSLLSKETAVVFILLIAFLQWWQKRMKEWVLYIYTGGVLLVYTILRIVVAHVQLANPNPFIPLLNAPFSIKLLNIPAIIFYYLRNLFYPGTIAVDQNWVVRTATLENFYFPLFVCLLIGIIILGTLVYLHKKKNQDFQLFLFFTVWFLAFLALALPIIPLDFTVADRWFYFPFVGLLGMIGIVAQYVQFQKKFFRNIAVVVIVVAIGALGLRTAMRNTNWQSNLALFTHDIVISQDSFDLENNLGTALLRAGDLKGAEMHLKKALTLAPELPEALLNLGIIYEDNKDIPNAKKYYLLAAQHGVSMGLANYAGDLLFYDNDASGAVNILEKNIRKYPLDQQLWLYLAVAYQRVGNQESALKFAEYAYQLAPNQNSGYVYTQILHNLPVELK